MIISDLTKRDLISIANKLKRAGTDSCVLDLNIRGGTLRVKITYEVMEDLYEQSK